MSMGALRHEHGHMRHVHEHACMKHEHEMSVTVLSRFCHGFCLANIENHWFSIGFTTQKGVTVSSRLSRFRHGFDFHVFLDFPLVL